MKKMTSEDKGLISLIDIWASVGKRRLETYNYTGILYFERDGEGVVHEEYFKSFEDFIIKYPNLKTKGLMVDLSKKE